MPTDHNQSSLCGPRAYPRHLRPTLKLVVWVSAVCILCALLLMDSILDMKALAAYCLLLACLAVLLKMNVTLIKQNDGLLHFEETLEAITDIYWQWDLATGRFQYSGKLAELLGYEDRKPKDGFWKEIIHPIDRPLQKYHLLRHLEDETIPYYGEYRFLNRYHEYEWFAGRGKVVRRNSENEPLLMVGSIEHIQPRKDLEQNLIHAHKMKALGQLTGGIAHDFNNILGSVLGYAELITESGSPSKMQQYGRQILEAGSRARDVVSQLLDFSRTSKGEVHTLNLKTELDNTSSMIRASIPSAIKVQYNWPGVDCFTEFDPNQLQRVLLNLCLNARDAMGNTGILTISLSSRSICHEVCASCQQPIEGAYHVLSVADTGSGIQEHEKKKLFEPFFTTKPFGEGVGMGLSVVHGIAHEAGGHVLVTSESQLGTNIELLMPSVEYQADNKVNVLPDQTGSKI